MDISDVVVENPIIDYALESMDSEAHCDFDEISQKLGVSWNFILPPFILPMASAISDNEADHAARCAGDHD